MVCSLSLTRERCSTERGVKPPARARRAAERVSHLLTNIVVAIDPPAVKLDQQLPALRIKLVSIQIGRAQRPPLPIAGQRVVVGVAHLSIQFWMVRRAKKTAAAVKNSSRASRIIGSAPVRASLPLSKP